MTTEMGNCMVIGNVLDIVCIRPLGVRPLIYPERVPKPWGFFVARFAAERERS